MKADPTEDGRAAYNRQIEAALARVFGDATGEWHAVFHALHVFARRTGCPLGSDVVEWFIAKTAEYRLEISTIRGVGPTATPPSADTQAPRAR